MIAVPEPWVSEITDLRLALGDEQAAQVPAHVTLLPPVPVAPCDRTRIIRHLRAVARRQVPFRISIGGGGSFRPVTSVAYIDVREGADVCAHLAEDVRCGPLDQELRFPYHPHVTLAQEVDDEPLRRAQVLAQRFHASWIVPGFRLDRVDASGRYSSMALFDFEGRGE